jgi:hypothetical protein
MLSLRLGIATGRDLAQLCRDRFSRPVAIGLWVPCELAIIACDLAEVIGAPIVLQLLFGLPLIIGVCVTALDVFWCCGCKNRGFRYIEPLVMTLLCLIGGCFTIELVLAQPDLSEIAASLLPSRQIIVNSGMLYIAIATWLKIEGFPATNSRFNYVSGHALSLHDRIWNSDCRNSARDMGLEIVLFLEIMILVGMVISALRQAERGRS